jgi:hypothetical protein
LLYTSITLCYLTPILFFSVHLLELFTSLITRTLNSWRESHLLWILWMPRAWNWISCQVMWWSPLSRLTSFPCELDCTA